MSFRQQFVWKHFPVLHILLDLASSSLHDEHNCLGIFNQLQNVRYFNEAVIGRGTIAWIKIFRELKFLLTITQLYCVGTLNYTSTFDLKQYPVTFANIYDTYCIFLLIVIG